MRHQCRDSRTWLVLAAAASALLLTATVITLAQGPTRIQIDQVDSADFPRVTVHASVSDDSGHAVLGLDEEAFTLEEDGQPIVPFSVEERDDLGRPIRLAVVLDTSGSMQGQPLQDAQGAAVGLIRDLAPTDEVAVISFAYVVTTHVPFTPDKERAIAAVEGLRAEGGTAFNDAAYEAVEALGDRPPGQKAVMILTDGDDTDSLLTIDDALDLAKESSIPIYVVGFGPDIRPDVLGRVARVTGGHFYEAPSSQELAGAFSAVAELLRTQYVFHYESSLQADDGAHTLRVQVDVGGVGASAEAPFEAPSRPVAVEILRPADGETLAGPVTLQSRVVAPGQVSEVTYLVDGNELATASGDLSYTWNTTGVDLGEHTLVARATDSAGNQGQAQVTVKTVEPVVIDLVAPTAEEAQDLRGEVIVEAQVEALHGVERVAFAVDGEPVAEVASPPYRFTWQTADWETGDHTLTATAYEVNGFRDEASMDVWVGFRGENYGLWVALGVLLIGAGVILPLAIRRRRKMMQSAPRPEPARPEGPDRAPADRAAAWLVVEQGPEVGRRWPLLPGETRLGRNRASNDVVVPSRTASRRHAVIRAEPGGSVYYDLETTNPTLVNGEPVVGSQELVDGDRIRIGDVVLRYTEEDER